MRKSIWLVLLILALITATYWALRDFSSKKPSSFEGTGTVVNAFTTIKSNCSSEADAGVEKKFQTDHQLEAKVIESLQTYWRDVYYKNCLYKNAVDEKGNALPKTRITRDGDREIYENPLMNFSFVLPGNTTVVSDNTTDPDADRQLYTSRIENGERMIDIRVKRGLASLRDVNSISDIIKDVGGLLNIENTIVLVVATTTANGISVLEIQEDNAQFGVAFLTPEKNLVYIYGKFLTREMIEMIEQTLSFPNPK